ncbi:MAG: hypothetical protein IJL25_10785, partial [Clostridia bacterium]|nr:hypothetical protein [Clostridia bacterium]
PRFCGREGDDFPLNGQQFSFDRKHGLAPHSISRNILQNHIKKINKRLLQNSRFSDTIRYNIMYL